MNFFLSLLINGKSSSSSSLHLQLISSRNERHLFSIANKTVDRHTNGSETEICNKWAVVSAAIGDKQITIEEEEEERLPIIKKKKEQYFKTI